LGSGHGNWPIRARDEEGRDGANGKEPFIEVKELWDRREKNRKYWPF
jgi:hypothetical protein